MNKRNLGILFILAILVAACVENIDISRGSERKIVVNCLLSNDSIQRLKLHYSSVESLGLYEAISDAKVTLWEGETFVGDFQYNKKKKEWVIAYRPIEGVKYKLTVMVPGKEMVQAQTIFPQKPPVLRNKSGDRELARSFYKKSNDLMWLFAFPYERYQVYPDSAIVVKKSSSIYGYIGCSLSHIDNFNISASIEPYYTCPVYHFYIRILPNDNATFFEVTDIEEGVVVFRSVSKEYDSYLKTSIEKMLVYTGEYDLKAMLDESAIYTNIENGVGIFGAYYDLEFKCSNLPFE